jgi:hypothetical protein
MPFRIETEWIDAAGIRGRELAATWASLLIGVDGEIVTRVVDERARTVRNDIYVPLYVLAEWLVTNWWFLFHEVENPSKEDDPAFGRRHALGASREGYAFPSLQVAPAGTRIRLAWTPDRIDSAQIEFLCDGQAWIESNDFRDCCSDFVDQVIRRLIAFGVEGTLLQEEWAAIQAAGADESKFCRVAAGLGRDPYALDDAERAALLGLEDILNEAVLEEAVAVLDADDLDANVAAVVGALEAGKAAGLSLERLRSLRTTIRPAAGGSPWDAGCVLAQHLRRQLELDGAPLASMTALGRAIGEDPEAVENVTQPRHFGAAALLDGVVTSDANGRPAFAIRSGRDEARRFQFCRGLAEVLVSPGSDALLTRARSDRQQRSRAFAAEFLAPSSGLRARVSRPVVGEDDVDALAAEFGVSPWLVAHQLRNHEIARIR